MSKTEVISASLRTELHPTQSANSQPKPNDGFVDVHDLQVAPSRGLFRTRGIHVGYGYPTDHLAPNEKPAAGPPAGVEGTVADRLELRGTFETLETRLI
jgi:hypothetical protein